jgi:hypothetical protein
MSRIKSLIVIALVVFSASHVSATEPCVALDKPHFISDVLEPSSLVVFGKIVDFSTTAEHPGDRWTKVEVVETLISKGAPPSGTITVRDWQSVDMPLYNYEKGSYVVLFLTGSGEYRLTNDAWKSCVPSIWNAKEDRTAYPNFEPATGRQSSFAPIESIRKLAP